MKKFLVDTVYKDLRIDKWLKILFSSLNQSFIEKNLRKGNIKVNTSKVSSNYKLKLKDEVIIFNYSNISYNHTPKKNKKIVIPQNYIKLFNSQIIFENENFLILDKWAGIATQGGSKINLSIDNLIKNISIKYNLVHRLDRETSGLLIIAKNIQSTKFFGKLFKERHVRKLYVAICNGHPKNLESEVKILISTNNNDKKEYFTITRYKVFEINKNLSIILFYPLTGKKHQIRIVAKHLGCPIIGDTKYNKKNKYSFEKLKLNAHVLKFNINNEDYNFSSNLPQHFKSFMKKNKFKNLIKQDLNKFL